ncbi:AAA family ATPase [Sorangium sp. So ce269]
MSQRIPIGVSDFRDLRERGLVYVDKTHLIQELLDRPGLLGLLLPRPRRFGKTLNLSMLRCFFERRDEDLSHLFEGLAIWRAGEAYRAHFQRYPVVFMTFRDVKAPAFEACWKAIRKKIEALFDEHRALLDSGVLSEREARDYRAILDATADEVLYQRALCDLSAYLHRAHGEKVVILIDEYDEPIHAGFVGGYAREVLDFFRAFLTGGIKDNPHLSRAVLTGILRVARESIFSGLNNIGVYSLLRTEFSTCFGFTEPEVIALLEDGGALDLLESVRRAYNGYVFGETVVYNPWSVLSFLASDDRRTRSYWVSTSANELIRDLLIFHALDVEDDIAVLLEGGAIEQRLDENVALDQLPGSPRALFGLLVFSGYLRAEATESGTTHVPAYRLSIPNDEVREVYTSTFRDWMEERLTGQGASSRRLVRALLSGDVITFEEQLRAFVTNVLSYHEARRLGPEEVYHGFVAGLLATLEPDYEVRSNRESGEGRPDVLVRPRQPGKPGVVLEMKVARGGQTLEQALEEGLSQIARRDYAAELRAAGASPVHALAVAFNGKQVAVRAEAGVDR